MNTTHILAEAGAVALVLLRVTAASSDWFPPLKGAAACALYIAELVKVRIHDIAHERALMIDSRDFNHTSKTGENLVNTFKVQLHALFGSFPMLVNLKKN
jgi:hypothetical protein